MVTRFDEAGVELVLPEAATVVVRIPASPWLSLVDAEGEALQPTPSAGADSEDAFVLGCLGETLPPDADVPEGEGEAEFEPAPESWTVLHAPRPGIYRIAAPYTFSRGTPCPDESPES